MIFEPLSVAFQQKDTLHITTCVILSRKWITGFVPGASNYSYILAFQQYSLVKRQQCESEQHSERIRVHTFLFS